MAFQVSFDVLKFSEALSDPGPTKIDWTHVTAPNIQVLLEGSDSRLDEHILRMDVVQGTTFLERLNIGEYIDRAKRLRASRDSNLKLEELPVFGITKEPVLALRYQVNEKARRLQLRLIRSEDFRQMVSILAKRGLQFSQQRPITGRPDSSSIRPTSTQQDDRPLTTNVARVAQEDAICSRSKPRPFKIPDIEAGSLSQRPFANAIPLADKAGRLVAPARDYSKAVDLAAHGTSQRSSTRIWTSHASQSNRPDIYDVEQGSNTHRGENFRDPNASLEAPGYEAQDFFQFSAPSSELGQGGLLSQQKGCSPGGMPSHAPALSSDPVDIRPSTAFSVTSGTSVFADTLDNEIPPERALPFKATGKPRPSSAVSIPSTASHKIHLQQDIPPARELPFKRSGSRAGGSSSSRPGSALPPPFLKTKELTERPKTASSVQKRSGEMSAIESGETDASRQAKSTRSPVHSGLPIAQSRSAQDQNEHGFVETLQMKELVFGSGRLSSNKRPRVSSTMDAPHEIETPPGTAEKRHFHTIPGATRFPVASVTAFAENKGDRDVAFVPADCSQQLELHQYASQTPEARQTALDQFMIDSLQDPSFTTLCEDVEQSWRRIALGL